MPPGESEREVNIGYCLKKNRSIPNHKIVTWCLTAGYKLAICKHFALLRKGKLIEIKLLEEEVLAPY